MDYENKSNFIAILLVIAALIVAVCSAKAQVTKTIDFDYQKKSISRDDMMILKATIELALSSKIAAERLVVGEWGNIRYHPIKDKKGNVTGYEAKFYVITQNIVEI